jgi:hypothetical protein
MGKAWRIISFRSIPRLRWNESVNCCLARDELLVIFRGLTSELTNLSKTHREEAASITRFADASAPEASRSRKNPKLTHTALYQSTDQWELVREIANRLREYDPTNPQWPISVAHALGSNRSPPLGTA